MWGFVVYERAEPLWQNSEFIVNLKETPHLIIFTHNLRYLVEVKAIELQESNNWVSENSNKEKY